MSFSASSSRHQGHGRRAVAVACSDPQVLRHMKERFPVQAAQAALIAEMDLRVGEVLTINVRQDDTGDALKVRSGTTGGRVRLLPIETPSQRAAVDAAKAVANEQGFLRTQPQETLAQARRRFFFALQATGVHPRLGHFAAKPTYMGSENSEPDDSTRSERPMLDDPHRGPSRGSLS